MYEERIARGAKMLDTIAPGWEYKINLETLNVAGCSKCVLGQVFGHNGALTAMALHGEECENNGFRLSNGEFIIALNSIYRSSPYVQLTAEWKLEIERRRSIKKMMSDICAAKEPAADPMASNLSA